MSRASQILVASFQLQHSPYPLRLVILLVVAGAVNAYLLPSVFAQPHKYTHGTLVSALNGRHLNAVGGGLELAGPVADTGGGGGSGLEVAAAVLDDPASGGEVLVPKTYPIGAQEPTCEQLRAMWIFSKRQSRAAEITNEIPTYRDPFAYNIWEPYYTAGRGMSSYRFVPRYGDRTRSPVFGRVISREPLVPPHMPVGGHRQRHYNGEGLNGGGVGGGSGRLYGSEYKSTYPAQSSGIGGGGGSRRPSQYRYVGANGSTVSGGSSGGDRTPASNPNSVAVQGSFQKLKELIWTERAKELTQQRRAEELAARAAVLKEIANGQNIMSNYKPPTKSESMLMDANRSPHHDPAYQHDGRMSIATGQSYTKSTSANTNKNYNKNNSNGKNDNNKGNNDNANSNLNKNGSNGKSGGSGGELNFGGSSRRSFDSNTPGGKVNGGATGDKSPIHFGRSSSGSGGNGRMMLPGALASSYSSAFDGGSRDGGGGSGRRQGDGYDVADELTRERERDYGVPRAFPMRPSHFRERNRSLYNKQRHGDYFERDIRQNDEGDEDTVDDEDVTSLERLIDNLNEDGLTSAAYVDDGVGVDGGGSSFEDYDAGVGANLFDVVDYANGKGSFLGDAFSPASMLMMPSGGTGSVEEAALVPRPVSLRRAPYPWRFEPQTLMVPGWSSVYDVNSFY